MNVLAAARPEPLISADDSHGPMCHGFGDMAQRGLLGRIFVQVRLNPHATRLSCKWHISWKDLSHEKEKDRNYYAGNHCRSGHSWSRRTPENLLAS